MSDLVAAGKLAAFVDAATTPIDRQLILDAEPRLGDVTDRLVTAAIGMTWVRRLAGRDLRSLDVLGVETDLTAFTGLFPGWAVLERCTEIGVEAALAERYGPYQPPV
jgi:hypothetical protein